MVEPGKLVENTNEAGNNSDKFVFWGEDGKIVPHLLFEYFGKEGIGKYYSDDAKWKNTESVIVKIDGNVVSEVNVTYLLETAKNYINECTEESGKAGPIIDSLHKSTSLFGDRNLKLLPTLKLEFISDSRDVGYLFFKNSVAKVTKGAAVTVHNYDEFDQYVWENNIVNIDFKFIAPEELAGKSVFTSFLKDLTIVEDSSKAALRFKSLSSAVGYLLHRFKDGTTTVAIILMDVYVNGMPNGRSGKTLLIKSVGKIRNLSQIDGKYFDPREWFSHSSVGLDTEVLLYNDVDKNFNFEKLFTSITDGLLIRKKYKDNIQLPHEKAPKIALTTNYAISGDTSSHRGRKFEFEVSPTFSDRLRPIDKYRKPFFDDWSDEEWNFFFNTMISCIQVYLDEGLVASEPINLKLTKVVNSTCEEFVEFCPTKIELNNQLDKKALYDAFLLEYPEYKYQLKQRNFTQWLRAWGTFKKYNSVEGHTGSIRYILFSENPAT